MKHQQDPTEQMAVMPDITSKQSGLILCLSGPSGVGKDTVIRELQSLRPNTKHLVSMTTRSPRGQEQQGVDYIFVAKAEFEELIRQDAIIEYDKYLDHYYGTPLHPLLEQIEQGNDVLLDITVAGSLAVKEKFPQALIVFLLPPSIEVLLTRLRCRGTEDEAVITRRIKAAAAEIKQAADFDYIIINDDLERSVEIINSIYVARRAESDYMAADIARIQAEFETY